MAQNITLAKEFLTYMISVTLQSDYQKHVLMRFLDSCCVYMDYCDIPFDKSTVQRILLEAAEECKTKIDKLVHDANKNISSSDYKPDSSELMRIKCPYCKRYSKLLGRYEAISDMWGVAFKDGGYVPTEQDIIQYDVTDVRKRDYYCSNCNGEFTEDEIDDFLDDYDEKQDKKTEPFDMFEDDSKTD